MNAPKTTLRRLGPALSRFMDNVCTLAFRYGQWKSLLHGVPVDAAGNALPWYTYPAIEYLSQFDLSSRDIFEFGGGNSSHFWAVRARSVVTVERDATWYGRLRQQQKPNQTLLLRERREAYLAALAEQPQAFDIIVIDGSWRHACADVASQKLHPYGLIVVDNSDKFPQVGERLRARGYFQVDFNGLGPVNNYAWTTSLFLRLRSELQRNYRPPEPTGGLQVRISPSDEDIAAK